jgi:hypothetical protein
MLTVSNSSLSGNTASGSVFGFVYGGGIYNNGTLTVSNSTLSGNTAKEGGAIAAFGTVTVSNSTLSGNSAVSAGGGIYNFGILTVSNSTLSGNQGSGVVSDLFATLTVSNSTLSGNTGVGIFTDGTLTVSNSTLSGNTGGGILSGGDKPITLTNVTLTANRSSVGGGGLAVFTALKVSLHNTLIAGNFHGATGTIPDDVFGQLDPGGDNNLIGDGTNMSGLVNGVNGNQVGTADNPIDPRLGPLADNGGPTLTHALLPGSPAIDAGNNAYATDFDQRGPGFPRIVNGTIDIGAFEFQGAGAGPSTSRSSRGQEARLAQLVAGLPTAVSNPVADPPALSPGQGSTITGAGPFVAPWEAASGLAVAAVDSSFATVFEDRSEQTAVPWSDLELAAIGWLPELAPPGAAVGSPGL